MVVFDNTKFEMFFDKATARILSYMITYRDIPVSRREIEKALGYSNLSLSCAMRRLELFRVIIHDGYKGRSKKYRLNRNSSITKLLIMLYDELNMTDVDTDKLENTLRYRNKNRRYEGGLICQR